MVRVVPSLQTCFVTLSKTFTAIFQQRRPAGIETSPGNIVLGSGLPEAMSNSPGRDWALASQVQDTVVFSLLYCRDNTSSSGSSQHSYCA